MFSARVKRLLWAFMYIQRGSNVGSALHLAHFQITASANQLNMKGSRRHKVAQKKKKNRGGSLLQCGPHSNGL